MMSQDPQVVKVPDYTASPRQEAFHLAVADEKLYGGAAGGGKTAAIVAEGVTLALEYPGIPVDFFRRTIPELKGTILPEIYKQCAAYINAGHMRWIGQERCFILNNGPKLNGAQLPGSKLNLNYLDNDNDIYRYQGREMPVILIDELTQFPWAWIEYLKTRNRSSNPDWPIIFAAGSNPGGIGHGAVKTRFIDAAPPETIFVDPETGESRIYIPAKVDDHPLEAFRNSYSKKLNAIKDQDLKRALKDGDWDVFAGQAFTEWRRSRHVVDPFTIPDHWQRWFAYDWGYNSWAAGLWFARDPNTERIYIYRELYETRMRASKQAEFINTVEQSEDVPARFADPSVWSVKDNYDKDETVIDVFAKNKINFVPANNDRLSGKNAWHEALAPMADGLPGLQVFSNCVNLIRSLPSLVYDKVRVEDIDTKTEDHLYDAGRYGLLGQVKKATEDESFDDDSPFDDDGSY